VGFVLSNGKRIEGEGVVPDHAVAPALADLVVSRDRALEAAQELLKKKIAAAGSNPATKKEGRPKDAGG
jgi:C-terminal processing protease CtpA/Prc